MAFSICKLDGVWVGLTMATQGWKVLVQAGRQEQVVEGQREAKAVAQTVERVEVRLPDRFLCHRS